MRIIGGELRRRKIVGPPPSATTRPITDLVREAVFNLLRGHFEGAKVFDGFAGTGTIGLEAVSRGASKVVFCERDRRVVRLLEQNIRDLDVVDRCVVVAGDAMGPAALARCPNPCDVIFFDPPYAMVRDPDTWPRVRLGFSRLIDQLAPTGFAVLRTPWPFLHTFPEHAHPQDQPDEPAPPPHAKARGRKGEQRTQKRPAYEKGLGESLGPNPDLDALDDAPEPKHKTPVRTEEVDLTFDNAEGPETHAYGTTAIHLYMKRSGDSA